MPVKWTFRHTTGWHTETREGATINTLKVENNTGEIEERGYLVGGLSRELFSSLVYLRINALGCISHLY